ncbi:MAG: CHRD domain-containing protein, partial [Cyanobacteria bacterium J06649_11]
MSIKPLSIIIVILVVLLLFIPGKTLAATQTKPVTLLPRKGQEIGFVYEAFLNPNQEPGEEEDTPRFAPKEFLSTEPSVPRNQRKSRGHGMLKITNDLSKAYVYVKTENVNFEDINMFHIHCGRPDQLGPILIDLSNSSNIQKNFADGTFEVELRNEDIEKV